MSTTNEPCGTSLMTVSWENGPFYSVFLFQSSGVVMVVLLVGFIVVGIRSSRKKKVSTGLETLASMKKQKTKTYVWIFSKKQRKKREELF